MNKLYPESENEPCLEGDMYYVPSLSRTCKYRVLYWCGDQKDNLLLRRKMIHLTKEAAIKHAEALIVLSGGVPDDKLEDMKGYCYGDSINVIFWFHNFSTHKNSLQVACLITLNNVYNNKQQTFSSFPNTVTTQPPYQSFLEL